MAADRPPRALSGTASDLRGAPALTLVPGAADLRWSRIRDVRARILAGYYDRDDVRSRLADAVLRRMPKR